jgi:hypothetical protein
MAITSLAWNQMHLGPAALIAYKVRRNPSGFFGPV